MLIHLHTTPHLTRLRRGLSALLMCALWPLMATLAHADAVTDWNETAIRAAASVGISTGWQSRVLAIAHAAMTPFVLKSSDQFTMPGPAALDSAAFARDLREIQAVGAHRHTSRTAEQTEVAIYWTVWTHMPFNAAARAVAATRGHSLVDNARLFALLNMAGADSQIACWYWKYRFDFWRPVTAIRAADRTENAALTSDPHWEPLLNTPAHPDYPSGHATYGGAAAEVLKAVLGDGRADVSFVSTGVTRTYTSFSQLDREIIDARGWGGIHFRQTDEDSSALGHQVGADAVQTWLRPLSPTVGLR